jgi:pyruvate/2-oxoglutarate dehydrogenase complex dihydrolipoamide dehydrogenase (E3) component
VRLVVLGGGPAGVQAATTAARLGVSVTLVEDQLVGGTANLRDCIPSKAMIATAGALAASARHLGMGLHGPPAEIDLDAVRRRIAAIETRLHLATVDLLARQRVEVLRGRGRLQGTHDVAVATDDAVHALPADAIVIATGSRPRIPPWARPDGRRVLLTRDAYPPPELPDHIVIVGSGVTGVEFAHMFSALGAAVTLIVSRQHVLPTKDPEVAAALEDDFTRRGLRLLKGARATSLTSRGTLIRVSCDDGRSVDASHVLLAIGSIPNTTDIGLESVGLAAHDGATLPINHHCQTPIPHIYAAGDVSGALPLASVAAMQGRKIAEHIARGHTVSHRHLNYDRAPAAIFTDPEIADVGLAEAEAFAAGRKIRVTKVPFASTARALINDDARGFVKILSDPATGVVLGGSIVGQSAAELISIVALAVTAELTVADLVESMFVHPALAEAVAEAAE